MKHPDNLDYSRSLYTAEADSNSVGIPAKVLLENCSIFVNLLSVALFKWVLIKWD